MEWQGLCPLFVGTSLLLRGAGCISPVFKNWLGLYNRLCGGDEPSKKGSAAERGRQKGLTGAKKGPPIMGGQREEKMLEGMQKTV